jgi:hypothetical protein
MSFNSTLTASIAEANSSTLTLLIEAEGLELKLQMTSNPEAVLLTCQYISNLLLQKVTVPTLVLSWQEHCQMLQAFGNCVS